MIGGDRSDDEKPLSLLSISIAFNQKHVLGLGRKYLEILIRVGLPGFGFRTYAVYGCRSYPCSRF
jgi:hypothetical protein